MPQSSKIYQFYQFISGMQVGLIAKGKKSMWYINRINNQKYILITTEKNYKHQCLFTVKVQNSQQAKDRISNLIKTPMKRPIANNNRVAKECIFSPKVKNKTRMSAFTTSANTVLDDTIRQRKLTGCRDSWWLRVHTLLWRPGSGSLHPCQTAHYHSSESVCTRHAQSHLNFFLNFI